MKKLFIVANWKSYKSTSDAHAWLLNLERSLAFIDLNDIEVVVCPSYTSLPSMKAYILQKNINIKLGAQDISPFDEGAYTGEVNGQQVKEVGEYSIIGHSERRKEFGENDALIYRKVEQAQATGITPIVCVQGDDTPIPQGVSIVAYEPIFAIGTGTPDTPEHSEGIASTIKTKNPFVKYVLYGGSVNPGDVKNFTAMPSIDGVLVGGASLDPEKFSQIIENA